MPLVTIKLIEGVFTSEQKQKMIQNVTEAMVAVEGEKLRPLTWVIVEDNIRSGDWGIAGRGATKELVKDIQGGKINLPGA